MNDGSMPPLELQMLTASDPNVRANMMRHTVALRFMLTGKLHDRETPGVLIGANFGATLESVDHYTMLTQTDGCDRVMIGFDVDDALGTPETYGLWHFEKGIATFYDRCTPWAAPGEERALLLAGNAGGFATFRKRPAQRLLRTPGVPEGDLGVGIHDAKTRLAGLVDTPAIRDAVGDIHIRIQMGDDESFVTLPEVVG